MRVIKKLLLLFFILNLSFLLFACSKNNNKTNSIAFIEDDAGHKMYKDNDGIFIRNDWYEINGDKYFFDGNGYLLTDQWINEEYYVDETGKMKTNFWKEENNQLYYLGNDGKYLKNGLHNIEGKEYYFDSYGVLFRDAIIQDDTGSFYADKRGVIVKEKGPFEFGGNEYYIGDDGKLLQNKWINDHGTNKYFNDDCERVLNGFAIANDTKNSTESEIKTKWNFINKDGEIVKNNWAEYNSKWYYADEDGILLSNTWKTIDGDDYFFGQDCDMLTNQFINNTYYVDENGKKIKNTEKNIDGTNYVFDANGKSNKKIILKTENDNWKLYTYTDSGGKYISGKYYYKTTYANSENYSLYSTDQYLASINIEPTLMGIYFVFSKTKKNKTAYDTVFLTVEVNNQEVISSERIATISDKFLVLTQSQRNTILNSLLTNNNKIKISIVDSWFDGDDMDYYGFEFYSTGFNEIYPSLQG